jgi:membrane-associated phospholipid phosphatase
VQPNQRLQRAGACGSTVEWPVSATEVLQVLCGWRARCPPLRRISLGCKGDTVVLRARGQLVGLAAVSVAVALCMLLVDRPLALWLNTRFYGTAAFTIGAIILQFLERLLIAGAVFLVVAVGWRRLYGAPEWVNRLVVGGAGAAVALLGALVLKVAIGRSQVYPPFLQDHIYGFRLFAGSENFMAFPSATMAGVGAFVVGVGVHRRSQRAAAAVILITLAVALIVTGSHWLSDIIGGTYVGVISGAAVARRLSRPEGLQPNPMKQGAVK